jgi:PKD repeat protein
MKKLLLSFIMLFAIATLIAQQVPRSMVALEIGTGTWCQYCPGAAMGADDLLANGKFVAVIENHNGDSYANNYSNARNTYYNITGYPTAVFDGVLKVVGGNHTTSMYNSYLPKYNTRIAKLADLTLEMEVTNNGLDYTAVITITKVGTITATDLKLMFFVTQSNIQQSWQGQSHLEHVNRLMVPDQNGTTVDFTSGDVQIVTLNWTMSSAWPIEDCEFIPFVQGKSGKEVFNAIKRGAIDLSVDFTASGTQFASPGAVVNFTNNTSGGYIGVPETYNWYFPGGTPSVDTAKNPVITYNKCGLHDVTLTVNRGGQIVTTTKTEYISVGTNVVTSVYPNDTTCWYQPITLDATTPNATYLWTPGGATTPTFVVTYPEYGYGANNFSVTVSTPDGCVTTKTFETYFDVCTGIQEKSSSLTASIFPNPNNGKFLLELNSSKGITTDLRIMNTLGATVYEESGLNINGKVVKTINLNLNSGLYFLVLQDGDKKVIQKLFVN